MLPILQSLESHNQIPTLEEMAHEFKGCTLFSKLDLNKGYHQIALSPKTRNLTSFATKKGIFRYTRLIFGMSDAAEIYQCLIEEALSGLQGVWNISDDIIIGGKDEAELSCRTEAVLKHLVKMNLTLKRSKCRFLKSEITYLGHKLFANGVSPDKNRIDSISMLKPPTNIKELCSFLGMITYCSKFLQNFATVTAPLRSLLKKDTLWLWDYKCCNSFNMLKEMLLSTETLAYFDPKASTVVVVDASPVGVGAVISQMQPDGTMRPISYASRSLSPVEQRYNQIERVSCDTVCSSMVPHILIWHYIYHQS